MSRPTRVDLPQQHQLTPSIRFLNGEIHDWYRMVLGYPDHLVASLFARISVDRSSKVLDPFCGSGTTLVECMKRGVSSVGIDANPVAVYASLTKTTWNVDSTRVLTIADDILKIAEKDYRQQTYCTDLTYKYLRDSGMLDRGWICPKPLRKALAIKRSITKHHCTDKYKRLLRLCLLSEVVLHASNVKFGPEIFCAKKKWDVAVFGGFRKRIQQVAQDLDVVDSLPPTDAIVIEGDSRTSSKLLPRQRFTHCVCSPPYPTEHDYTRNSRLELAFLERVRDVDSLRQIKKGMIRSHTKCIYKGDRDGDLVSEHEKISSLVRRLRRAVGDAHGFVGLYPDVVAHYFGGMKKHFDDPKKILASGARCAYVVGDQSSYRGIRIPTAEILGEILDSLKFRDIEIVHWRGRWSSARSHMVNENVLLFAAPDRH